MAGIDIAYWFGISSAALATLAFAPYVLGILRGSVRPQRATWLVWVVLSFISFFSNLAMGAGSSLPYLAGQAGFTGLVFLLSIFYGSGSLLRARDMTVLALAGIGLLLWNLTASPMIALVISIGISALAGTLTVRKAYLEPDTESRSCWLWSATAAGLAFFSVGGINLELLLYPMYLAGLYASILVAMELGAVRNALAIEEPEPVPFLLPRKYAVGPRATVRSKALAA